LLREAARREADGDDPWGFLLGVPGMPREYAQVFKAAQSQRRAWRRLLDRSHGWGNFRERCEQLGDAPPGAPIRECQRQWFSRIWRVERWAMLDDPGLDDETRAGLEQMANEEERKLVKRCGRGVLELPAEGHSIGEDQTIYTLVRHWVRCGEGGPGLMFFSSPAMTHYIYELHNWPRWDDNVARVKKARRRILLTLADEDNPFIRGVKFAHALRTITGEGRGSFRFEGEIHVGGRCLFPRKQP
jgi:hypothetical protein